MLNAMLIGGDGSDSLLNHHALLYLLNSWAKPTLAAVQFVNTSLDGQCVTSKQFKINTSVYEYCHAGAR